MSPNDYSYFDYAAATPMSDAVKAAMEPYFQDIFFNPSASYLPARQVKEALAAARQNVAETIGARASEIIFTAGGTEANNLAIHGVLAMQPGGNVVTSTIEHDSVLVPAGAYEARAANVDERGVIDIDELLKLIDEHTVLVSVMYANNEVGSVQPVRELARRLVEIRRQRRRTGNSRPLYLHTDAAQAANYLDLHVARLGVDLLTLNGGKIYGPKQSGILYIRGGITLQPQLRGGGQERGLRSGTENVAADIGFAVALAEAQQLRRSEADRLSGLQGILLRELKKRLPAARINGSTAKRLPNNVHIALPGTDNERVLLELEAKGILASAGSACSASSEEPSHVLAAMGLSDADIRSSLRFTMGRQTTEHDVRRLVEALVSVVA